MAELLLHVLPGAIRAWLVWILVGNAADVMLTLWGLSRHAIHEGNPLMAAVLAVSPALAVLLKFLLAVSAVLALTWVYPGRPRLVGAAVGLLGLAMLVVVGVHSLWVVRLVA